MQAELGAARILRGLVGRMGAHGDANALGPAGGVLGGRQAVGDLVAPVDREGGHQAVGEHLHLVVADHHHHVRRRLGEHLAQGRDGPLAAVEPFVGDLWDELGGDVLAGPGRLQFRIGPDPAAEGMGVLAVVRGAEMPVLRRGGQHRPVRGADAQDDLRHLRFRQP